MTTYRILYWQEVPSQIRAEDESDEVSLPLPSRFQEEIDRLAVKRGLQGSDDYLAQWAWGEEQSREGSARNVAEAVAAELERTIGLRLVEPVRDEPSEAPAQ